MIDLKVFESFAGYASQAMALRNAGIKYRSVGISEIDKYAIIAYDAVHGDKDVIIEPQTHGYMVEWLEKRSIGMNYKTGKNTLKKSEVLPLYEACRRIKNQGNISLINPHEIEDIDLFTYSFPCQDISLAGNQKGLTKGEGTRSGLLWDCLEIIKIKRPYYLLMENVKNLIGKKFLPDFLEWCKELEDLGYENTYQVMNAKEHGVPQNRERVFMVSIFAGDPVEFPSKEPLEIRLKDILETEVDEKYYLSAEVCAQFVSKLAKKKKRFPML